MAPHVLAGNSHGDMLREWCKQNGLPLVWALDPVEYEAPYLPYPFSYHRIIDVATLEYTQLDLKISGTIIDAGMNTISN